jgi:hypothetical protein
MTLGTCGRRFLNRDRGAPRRGEKANERKRKDIKNSLIRERKPCQKEIESHSTCDHHCPKCQLSMRDYSRRGGKFPPTISGRSYSVMAFEKLDRHSRGSLMGQAQWQWQHPVIRRQKSVEANVVSAMRQKQGDRGRIVAIGTCTEQCCSADGSPSSHSRH